MDETPDQIDDELARLNREADAIDINQYKKRFRLLKAVGLGAAGAGLVWLVMAMLDGKRNPCERVRDHFCRLEGAASINCKTYQEILDESQHDPVGEMRQNIRGQCQTKIERLRDEDGVTVK